MGSNRTSFEKLQREGLKRARAEAKRQRRQNRAPEPEAAAGDDPPATAAAGDEELSAEALMGLVARLHDDFDNDRIDFEAFEERKLELMARLTVD